jgi:translation initiation factor IF-2
MEPGLAPPPVEPARGRPGDKRPSRPQPRERQEEEKILRPQRRQVEQGPPPINREITISEGITLKELSEKLDVKAALVMKKLMDRGIFATINQTLDSKLATEVAREFGASTATISYEEEAMQAVEEKEETKDLQRRAPVVTIMGHVDHGKTSLLDAIREANVAGREAGGITQHIGAYSVEMKGRKIVFIDTPGHEAFTRMRARGAKVTDIVILVVAADDGVMPQTLEAIDHARAAKVPIIVAINKIDKADAQPERIKQQLSDRGLLPEDWGGDTVMVPVSAKTQQNLELLLEMILLVADMGDLKANPNRPAMGTVIEAQLDRGRGPVATVLVRNGTLAVGDFFICGSVFGKVRAMQNDRGAQVRKAEPSTPVEVLGLESLPEAGDDFQVVTDTAKAKQIVNFRDQRQREAALAKSSRLTLEQLHKQMRDQGTPDHHQDGRGRFGGSAQRNAAEAIQRKGEGAGASLGRGRHQRIRRAAGVGIQRDYRGLQRTARAKRGGAGGTGKGRCPAAHHHLQPDRRDQGGDERPAGSGVQGSLQGQGRGPRHLPYSEGGQRGRMPGSGRLDRQQERRAAAARQRGGLHGQGRFAAALQR